MTHRTVWALAVLLVIGATVTPTALAQEVPEDAAFEYTGAEDTIQPTRGTDPPTVVLSENGLPHVLITGYWPPTNEMLRQWSQDPEQNPGGWVGENWEGRGYNIYAFFPEFPGGTGQNPKGDGDFEVDYQDTV